jgi:pilus assembly protein CpaC
MWRAFLMATVIATSAPGARGVGLALTRITGDATAQFVPLEQGKFIGIDLPRDAKEVQVANPTIANAILRKARKVTILGMGNGQTKYRIL